MLTQIENAPDLVSRRLDHYSGLAEYCYFWFCVIHCLSPLLDYSAPLLRDETPLLVVATRLSAFAAA